MAIHIGWAKRGWPGLIVAGLAFIVPAALITGLVASLYLTFGLLPSGLAVLRAVKPVVLVVVLQAIGGLWRTAAPTTRLRLLAIGALLLALAGVHELLLLLICGVVSWALASRRGVATLAPMLALPLLPTVSAPPTLPSLFGIFAKIGAVLYGSGYVLIAFLRSELVDRRGWMTIGQLVDAVAVGQVTPGPVFTTATFIGYLLDGPWGAAVATAGIFLPAFIFVAISGPLVPRLRRSAAAASFLDGVNAASLALMAAVTLSLAREAVVDLFTLGMTATAAILLQRGIGSFWLIVGAAALAMARWTLAGS